MTYKINVADLGIENDDTTFTGETPGEVVSQVVDHLRIQHDLDMPNPKLILSEETPVVSLPATTAPAGSGVSNVEWPDDEMSDIERSGGEKVAIVVRRLRSHLGLANGSGK